MLKRSLIAAVISSAVLVGGCSGGGGSDGTAPASASTPTSPGKKGDGIIAIQRADGPLDGIQNQLSAGVFVPLADAATGTPLENLLRCADQAVTHNTLDIADSVLTQLQLSQLSGGDAPLSPDPQQLTGLLGSLAANLTQLLQTLAGTGNGCIGSSLTLEQINSSADSLAGTPFESLGTELGPLLTRIAGIVDRHESLDSSEPELQLDQVAYLITHIDYAMQLGLQQVPLEVRRTPVIGGVLNTVATALTDSSALLNAVMSHDPAATTIGLQTLLENTLINSLTHVLPARAIENRAGQPDLISRPIRISARAFGSRFAENASTASTAELSAALDSVLEPVQSDLLPPVLSALSTALSPDVNSRSLGDPLAPTVDAINGAIDSLLAGGGAAGNDSDCLFVDLPLLSGLCRTG